MFALVVQTVLLFAIAFILGCVVGCLLRNLFGAPVKETGKPAKVSASKPAPVAPTPKEMPVIPEPPVPVAPVQPSEPAKVEMPPAAFAASEPAKEAPTKQAVPVATSKPVAVESRESPPAQKIGPAAKPDNLKLIRGIGPQNEARLNSLGVNSFAQIASWSRKEEAHFGDVLSFPGRIEREDWAGQAKVLAKGGTTDFSKRVRQGDVKSSTSDVEPVDRGAKPSGLLSEPRDGKEDSLTLIDGVGNALEKKLFKLGIYHFDQIAQMSAAELTWLGHTVGFPGRPERENWAGEAKVLAAGDATDPAQRVERGEIKTSRKSDD